MATKAMSYSEATKTIAEAMAQIEKIKKSVEQNNKTVKLDSVICFFEKYCERTSKDDGWGGSYPIWKIGYQDKPESKYGFSDIQDMIDRIVEIDKGTLEPKNFIREILNKWNLAQRWDNHHTIVIVFPNEVDMSIVGQINKLIMKDDTSIDKHTKDSIRSKNGNVIYYVDDKHVPCGVSAVSDIVFYNIHKMKNPKDTYISWLPSLITGCSNKDYFIEDTIEHNIERYLKELEEE